MALALAIPASASGERRHPERLARCNDGTYSYSQTHSGTCSHHGGVAQWLMPSTTRPNAATDAPPQLQHARRPRRPRPDDADRWKHRRRQHDPARAANENERLQARREPGPALFPGAYYSKLTKVVICSSSFRTGPIRNVPESEKHRSRPSTGWHRKGYGRTLEIDHIVCARARRLQRHREPLPGEGDLPPRPGYHVKDKLENKLHDLVCAGAMTLRTRQTGIASNWQTLYKKVFGNDPVGTGHATEEQTRSSRKARAELVETPAATRLPVPTFRLRSWTAERHARLRRARCSFPSAQRARGLCNRVRSPTAVIPGH